jgi:hypothetical protein
LDNTWSSFTASILNSLPATSDVSFTDVETRLLAEATRVISSTAKAESALKTSKAKLKPKHCERHGKCAHTTDECNTLKAEHGMKKARKSKVKAHHAETATDESSEDSSSEDVAQANHVVTSKKLMKRIAAYAAVPSNLKKNAFILDSGCSRHMFPKRGYFVPGTFKPHKQQVSFGDESTAEAIGYGDVCLRSNIKGNIMEITLSDCLYIPSFAVSLMSVQCLCRKGMEVSFSRHTCSARLHQQIVLQGQHHNGLYHLNVTPVIDKAQANLAIDINVMHRRMGYVTHERIQQLVAHRRLKHVNALTGKP